MLISWIKVFLIQLRYCYYVNDLFWEQISWKYAHLLLHNKEKKYFCFFPMIISMFMKLLLFSKEKYNYFFWKQLLLWVEAAVSIASLTFEKYVCACLVGWRHSSQLSSAEGWIMPDQSLPGPSILDQWGAVLNLCWVHYSGRFSSSGPS